MTDEDTMRLVTPEEMVEMDRRTIEEIGIPGIVLMERAALGAVDVLLDSFELPLGRVGFLCGGGNNGADGMVMARMLDHIGIQCVVVHLSADYSGDAAIAFDVVNQLELELIDASELEGSELVDRLESIPPCDVWCDAMLGTGIDRAVEGRYATAIDFLAGQDAILAVDIPSGLCGRRGEILGTGAPADVTVTFGLPKLGQALYPGRDLCGDLVVVDIGIPGHVEDAVGCTANGLVPESIGVYPRPSAIHKGDAGRVACVGGTLGKTGAILMTAQAALSSGAGLVVVGTDEASTAHIAPAVNEAMAETLIGPEISHEELERWLVDWADVVAIGPGLGQADDARRALEAASSRRAVVDADALNMLAEEPLDLEDAVLTPHPGEAARLLEVSVSEVMEDTLQSARALAERYQAIVCLKTAATVVAAPDGRLAINMTGNPGMASGGMGDALTGILAATACEIDDLFDASCLAVCVHGWAADLAAASTGHRGLTVSRLLEMLPEVWRLLERS